jgi:hypothetical protein
MVVGASDIDSSSCYSSWSSSDEDENWHKGKRSSKNINGMCFTAQGLCGMAHSSASKKSNMDDMGSDSEEELTNDPSFLIVDNARLNICLITVMMCLEIPIRRRGSIGLCLRRLRRRWLS